MNKIKLLYDVVMAMRNKDALQGVLTAEAQKDRVSIFTIRNEFEKNLLTRQTKAKISTEMDCSTLPHCESRNREFISHMHKGHCGGLKGTLARLALALAVLNALQVEEQEGKAVIISLNADDLPEDAKELIRDKISGAGSGKHCGHGFLNEFCTVDKLALLLKMFVNKRSEVEKILITFGGSQRDGQNEQHDLTARAELSFSW